ncbi:MAG: hypothetical protein QXU34_05950, partial [Ignisphaera sp.]
MQLIIIYRLAGWRGVIRSWRRLVKRGRADINKPPAFKAAVSSFGIGGFKYLFSSINSLMEEELLRPSEVAKKFGISVKTLW